VTETWERPHHQPGELRLAEELARSAGEPPSARSLARTGKLVVQSARAAGAGAVTSGRWFADIGTELATHVPVRDSETLRAQLPTIQNNAEVEERQEIESQITDLAKHGRYIEAYNLARHLVDKFPDSPQADVLRPQLTRLKELAHDPNAAPARVHVES